MYEQMRDTVRSQLKTLIEVDTPPPPPPPTVHVKGTKGQREGALKAIDALQEAFGPKGKYWVQGSYHNVKEGIDMMCISGGLNKIDGKHEALARIAISAAAFELFPERVMDDEEDWSDADRVHDVLTTGDSAITTFNDANATEWSDVVKVFNRARKILKS